MSRYDDDRDRYDDRGYNRDDDRGRGRGRGRDDGYDDRDRGYDDRDRGDDRGRADRDSGAIDRYDDDDGPKKKKKEKKVKDPNKPKKEKKKKRSQSSVSAERSREREMKRRMKQQQHAARASGAGAAMTQGIPDPGGGGGQRMFWDGFQWVPRADAPSNPNDPNVSRKMRRLYLGNLPYHLGITEDNFTKQLYETMKERGMCNDPNTNPILHIWFARDKGANYGFCECATVEEADRCLQLDGIEVMGVPVSIKRPTDANAPAGMTAGMIPGQSPGGTAALALPPMQVQATTSIIKIEELLKVKPTTTKQEYDDVVLDMNEGCGAHGKLKSVFVVRKEHADRNRDLKAGDVYLQCVSIGDATKIMRAMGHRKYDGRQITMKCHEEYSYNRTIKPLAEGKEVPEADVSAM